MRIFFFTKTKSMIRKYVSDLTKLGFNRNMVKKESKKFKKYNGTYDPITKNVFVNLENITIHSSVDEIPDEVMRIVNHETIHHIIYKNLGFGISFEKQHWLIGKLGYGRLKCLR